LSKGASISPERCAYADCLPLFFAIATRLNGHRRAQFSSDKSASANWSSFYVSEIPLDVCRNDHTVHREFVTKLIAEDAAAEAQLGAAKAYTS